MKVLLTQAIKPVPCQVRSKTQSPCLHRAVVEIWGVPFCEACAREQEAYFAIGEALIRMRRERELTSGIIAPKSNRSAIEESAEQTESASRPVGSDVCALPSAE
jgi:hypothetical protein